MEIGSTQKPAPALAVAPQRPDPPGEAGAVRSELPAEAAVQQAAAVEGALFEPHDQARARAAIEAAAPPLDRGFSVDPETRDLVYKAVDTRTGEIVTQIPEEALLRIRAYARDLRDGDGEPSGSAPRVEKVV